MTPARLPPRRWAGSLSRPAMGRQSGSLSQSQEVALHRKLDDALLELCAPTCEETQQPIKFFQPFEQILALGAARLIPIPPGIDFFNLPQQCFALRVDLLLQCPKAIRA